MYDVVALGELLIDFAPVSADEAGHPTLKAQPGGAPGNFLAALQQLPVSPAVLPAFRPRPMAALPALCRRKKFSKPYKGSYLFTPPCGGATGKMGLANVLDNAVQIVVDGVREKMLSWA